VRERNKVNCSISNLLDLFGPGSNLDLILSAKENWRREWDSIIVNLAISRHLRNIDRKVFQGKLLSHIAALNFCCICCS
jgi:hypothetical protein